MKTIERVVLVVLNKPGVLGRVAGYIRHEGWNIKRLLVDQIAEGDSQPAFTGASRMEIDIEGAHTKLAQVMDRLLNLDCVISIEMLDAEGRKLVHNRLQDSVLTTVEERPLVKAPPKQAGCFRILAVNPGSTSTKFAVYDNETVLLEQAIRHDEQVLAGPVLKQKETRRDCIMRCLAATEIPLESLDAIAGRGGLLKPIESGTYLINQRILDDLQSASAAIHASALGAIIAAEIAGPLGIPAYVVDPVVVDEMDRNAKLTGMPG
jgi:acetolactate synthase small subunit